MEIKLMIIMSLILIAAALIFFWTGRSLEKLKKMAEKNEKLLPDEKYFELKYKTQFMTFSFTLIIAFAGVLGFNSIQDIKLDLLKDYSSATKHYNSLIDSLINIRIDKTNEMIKQANNDLTTNLKDANSSLREYASLVSEINSKIGYNHMYLIKDLLITDLKKKIKVITFQALGFPKMTSPPTVFIEPKGKQQIFIKNVSKESFEIEIGETTSDSLSVSVMIFN